MKKQINVFWTGGWDSTFRIIQLSRIEGIIVQGVYVTGDGRRSEKNEINAINAITNALKNKPETKATIQPIIIIDKKDIPEHDAITRAYKQLSNDIFLGTQYEWLARYAFYNPGIELGAIMPDGEYSGITETVNKYAGFIKNGDTYKLDISRANEECILLFGNCVYPLIFTKERTMANQIKEWKYEDIMSLIWFCHRPYKNKPCGICRPCEQKMEGNMEFLLPDDAKKRYQQMKRMTRIMGMRGRLLLYKLYRI